MAAILAVTGAVCICLSVLGLVKLAPGAEFLPLKWDGLANTTVSTAFIILVSAFAGGWWLPISWATS